jgi:hypothetical protein
MQNLVRMNYILRFYAVRVVEVLYNHAMAKFILPCETIDWWITKQYNLQIPKLQEIVLNKIKNAFIDSNITSWKRTDEFTQDDMCDFYTISWY